MKKIHFLFALCFFFSVSMVAQTSPQKLNNTLRYLKLGNTLREAQQYELSEKNLLKALQEVQAQGDKYWEAAV
jgi:hypothetical protein